MFGVSGLFPAWKFGEFWQERLSNYNTHTHTHSVSEKKNSTY